MRKITALAALAAALAGCSDPARSQGSTHVDTSTLTAFCAAMVSVYEQKYETCFHATPAFAASELSASGCAAQQALVDAGRIAYDASQAASCVADMGAASCERAWAWEDGGAQSCATVLTGRTAPGGACAISGECAGGTCGAWTGACSGTCIAWLAAGDACGATAARCGPGLLCDASQSPARCTAPTFARAGEPCGAFGCDVGLWCDGAGTCRAKTADGDCTANDEACAVGSYCVAAGGGQYRCVPLVGVGDACGAAALCGPGSHCDATTGRCAADPGPGQPCAEGGWGDGCAGAYCGADGLCHAWTPAGGACTSPSECGPLSCEQGTCTAYAPECMP